MKNKYFSDEDIVLDDLKFMCIIIENIARKLKQTKSYVVNSIGYDNLYDKISHAQTLHCLPQREVANAWIKEFNLVQDGYDVTNINTDYCPEVPRANKIGKVYYRLIYRTLRANEDYIQGMLRIYNSWICEKIDNYNLPVYFMDIQNLMYTYEQGYY